MRWTTAFTLIFHQINDYSFTECSTNIFKIIGTYLGDDFSVNILSTFVWLSVFTEQLLDNGELE
jgi:hypothetical protein